MFCQNCRAENLELARFCFKCGTRIQQAAPKSVSDQKFVSKESLVSSKKVHGPVPGSINTKLDKNFYLLALFIAHLFALIGFAYGRSVAIPDPVLSSALFIVALVSVLYAIAIIGLFVYRMWTFIQDRGARTSPERAVGFLLIPLFNFYWVFQAFWGFAKDFNQYLQNQNSEVPRLPDNVFLALSIMLVVSPLFLFTSELIIAYIIISFFMHAYLVVTASSAVNMLASAEKDKPESAEVEEKSLLLHTFAGEPVKIGGTLVALLLIGAFITSFLLPRGQFEVNEVSLPDHAVYGEDLVVAVDTVNTGNAEGVFDLTIYIDDEEIESKNVSLEANSNKKVTFNLADRFTPGNYSFKLGLGPEKVIYEEYHADFRILKPAEFTLSNFEVEPGQIDIFEDASVIVDIANIGEVEGDYKVPFTVDGIVVQEQDISLGGGEKTKAHFDFKPEEPGLFSLAVNGFSETLEVFRIERPDNGTVLTNNASGGSNRFRVKNNRDRDVAVFLVNPDDPQTTLLAVYVHAGSSTTISRIRNGEYAIYFCHGDDWDSHSQRFTRNPNHNKFEGTERIFPAASYYYTFWVEFGVAGFDADAARTIGIDSDSFPTL